MKIGTDGVLIGAWTEVETAGSARVLDLGTGTGLVALMLAQRNRVLRIDAIDIDSDAAEQACENVSSSSFSEQINVYHSAVQDWTPYEPYDHVVSNPPFYSAKPVSPDQRRTTARHDASLPLKTLAQEVSRMLRTDGRFSVVWPKDREPELIAELALHQIFPERRCSVFPTGDKPCHRVLITFRKSETVPNAWEESLVIEQWGRGGYSAGFLQLLKDYYIDF